MAYSESFYLRLKKVTEAQDAFVAGLGDTLLSSAGALISPAIPPAVGILKGLTQAKVHNESASALHPPPIDYRYRPVELNDLGIQDGITLGLGMELGEFKDWMAHHEEKIGRSLSADERHEFLCQMLPSFSPTMLVDDLLTRHLAFSAQTGSGKTELMLSVADQQIARGGGMIIFEAKGKEGDFGVTEKVAALCEQYGRLDDFEYFSMDDAENCMTWNPWIAKNPRALINMAMALQPTDGEQFFRDMNKMGLTAAILALCFQVNPRPFSFKDLMAIFSDSKVLIELHSTMSESTSTARTAKAHVGSTLNFFVSQDKQGNTYFNEEMYQSRFAGLAATVGNFCHSEYDEIINSLNPDINIKESIKGNKITVISVSTLTDSEGVSTLGQIFMAALAAAIGDILKEGSKPVIPCITWLDEYPSFKSVKHQSLFQLVRAANIGLILSFQGLNFLKEESETFARNVIGNTWNVMFSDIKDDETREAAAKLSRTVIRVFKMENESQSKGKSHSSEGSGISHNKSLGTSKSVGVKATREDLVQPEDLYLEAGDALLIGKQETIRLRMPFVEFSKPIRKMTEYDLTRFDDRSNVGDALWRSKSVKSFRQFL